MLAPEERLQGRYRVLRPLGQGGMGTVYEAIDERLGTTVALKQLRSLDPAQARRFGREARLLARLRHPALPRVTDSFIDPAGHFLVMEFVPGADLAARLQQQGAPFPVADVLAWSARLLDAIHYLHAQSPSILHRDIKPANLKVTAAGDVMLLDFGLAEVDGARSAVATGPLVGYTLAYAPLEQIQGHSLDPRSDLFALAATLTELLTARKPPDALARALALTRGQPDPLRPIRESNPSVPPAAARVLEQALALDLTARPASARAFQAALAGADSQSAAVITATPRSSWSSALVTLLFTDIQGSTALWDRHRRAMSAALERHDHLLRELVAAHGGTVFKMAGDGVHAVFTVPGQAVEAAVAAQRALQREPWGELGSLPVRMALHTGEAELRDGDYFGPTLNRTARLLAAGHGNQILLSQATYQLAREFLPEGVELRDLGTYPLRGLAEPERVYQAVAEALPADFPALRTVPRPRPEAPDERTEPLAAPPSEPPLPAPAAAATEPAAPRAGRPRVNWLAAAGAGAAGVGVVAVVLAVAAQAGLRPLARLGGSPPTRPVAATASPRAAVPPPLPLASPTASATPRVGVASPSPSPSPLVGGAGSPPASPAVPTRPAPAASASAEAVPSPAGAR